MSYFIIGEYFIILSYLIGTKVDEVIDNHGALHAVD
jgi:hypothetical protein